MDEKQKLERVKDQLAAGVSEDTVRDTLLRDGHDDAAVDHLFREARAELETTSGDEGVAMEAGGAAVGTLPSFGEFFSGSWGFLKERVDVLVYLAIILVLFGWLPIVGSVVSVLVAAVALYVALHPRTSFGDAMSWMQDNFVSYLWVVILVFFVTFFSFMLLIIPGIIVGIYLVLAASLRIEQGDTGIQALVTSTQMIYGVWWGTFGRMLLLGLSAGVVAALLTALLGNLIGYSEAAAAEAFFYWPEAVLLSLSAVVVMVMAGGAARVYHARKDVVIDEAAVPASGTLRTLYVVFAWLGVVAFFSVILLALLGFAVIGLTAAGM